MVNTYTLQLTSGEVINVTADSWEAGEEYFEFSKEGEVVALVTSIYVLYMLKS